MDAFHSGKATTLVATDIAARGIHVDDVSLVVHADPPAEHKAYLHRSGRTARAGAAGTVITLMTPEQERDVRDLTRAAGIKPTITRVDALGHPVLSQLAPGERVLVPGGIVVEAPRPASGSTGGGGAAGGGGGRNRNRRRSGSGSGSGGQGGPRGQGAQGGGRQGGKPGSKPAAKQGAKPAARRGGGRPSGGGSHNAASFSAGVR